MEVPIAVTLIFLVQNLWRCHLTIVYTVPTVCVPYDSGAAMCRDLYMCLFQCYINCLFCVFT